MFWKRKPSKDKKAKAPWERKASMAGLNKSSLIKKLDKVFSLYIRLRDVNQDGYFHCPTCGRYLPFSKADCSHLWGRAHMSTRFDPDNVVAECSYDNRMNSSHLVQLTEYFKKTLGQQKFDLLQWKHNQAKNWSLFELQELIKYYQGEVERLKKEKNYYEWK